MKVKYIDINTGATKVAKFFEFDYVANQTILKDENGNLFCIAAWQRIAN